MIVFVTKEWPKEKYAEKLSGKTLAIQPMACKVYTYQ